MVSPLADHALVESRTLYLVYSLPTSKLFKSLIIRRLDVSKAASRMSECRRISEFHGKASTRDLCIDLPSGALLTSEIHY